MQFTKMLLVMHMTSIFIFACAIQVCGRGNAQTVSISVKNADITTIFNIIEKQTGFVFFYDEKELVEIRPYSIRFQKVPLSEALQILLDKTPLRFTVTENTVVISRKTSLTPFSRPDKPSSTLLKGIVRRTDGKSIVASVVVKGTKAGTTTNSDGYFELLVADQNVILEISSVGYETQEVIVGSSSFLSVVLNQLDSKLDEVKIIAYGTTTSRLSTGNITSVKAEDIEKHPVQNPILALQGRVPGLFITQNTGVANGAITFRIQGQNSIRTDANEPLIVIDGIPYFTQFEQTGYSGIVRGSTSTDGSPLSFINPTDIASIDVLKDADATSIYGSRAANGAILITTKKGRAGKMAITLNMQHGIIQVPTKVDVLNRRQYLDMRYEAFLNDGIDWRDVSVSANDLKLWDTNLSHDWQKTLIGNTGSYSNVNASLSGGDQAIQYLFGTTFNKTTSVFPGHFDDRRGALHFNLNANSLNRKFKISLTGNYLVDQNRLPSRDFTQSALFTEPVAPKLYNTDGTLNWALNSSGGITFDNPLFAVIRDVKYNTKNLFINSNISYQLLPGLDLKCSFGHNNLQSNTFLPVPLASIRPDRRATTPRSAGYSFKTFNSLIIEPQLTYLINKGKLKIESLLGGTYQQKNDNILVLEGTGYSSDQSLSNVRAATTLETRQYRQSEYKYAAMFGRINLNFDNTYILNFTGRRDGSSRFGEKNRFYGFGSIGAGFVFTELPMLKSSAQFVSFGKLRASYGSTGSDQIGDYGYLNLYNNSDAGIAYQGIVGLLPSALPNPYLQWERTNKFQLGLELGFVEDRILLSITRSYNRTSNQLLSSSLPSVSGFNGIGANLPAIVENHSWEGSITSIFIKSRKLSWSANINFTTSTNKVASFPDIENSPYASGFNGVILGQPLGIIKSLRYIGVDAATGDYIIADSKGDPIIGGFPSQDDYSQLINLLPRFYGGLSNSLEIGRIQLDFLFQFVRQMGPRIFYYDNGNRYPGNFFRNVSNQPATVLNRWRKPGDEVTHGRFNSDGSLYSWPTETEAGYSFDASYIKLRNVSLSWEIPSQWLGRTIKKASVYVQAQNVLTISNYSGPDPETQSLSVLPILRTVLGGVKIEL